MMSSEENLLDKYEIVFSQTSLKTLKELKRKDAKRFKKIQDIIEEIAISPKSGKGKPEPLKHYGDRDVWSRRVNQKERIVYEIHEKQLVIDIITVGGHYGDK